MCSDFFWISGFYVSVQGFLNCYLKYIYLEGYIVVDVCDNHMFLKPSLYVYPSVLLTE